MINKKNLDRIIKINGDPDKDLSIMEIMTCKDGSFLTQNYEKINKFFELNSINLLI